MSNRHANSRRQSYGRRQKDLRTRRSSDLDIDLEGPGAWQRGAGWEPLPSMRNALRLAENGDGNGAR
jgi:hypothetical protein